MGIIRKTLSISTLGVVPFRSKRELLRRAEKARRAAAAQLEREQAARSEADRRVAAAEKRVQGAELLALHEAKVAAKAKAKRSRRGRRGRRKALERFGDLIEGAQPVVEQHAKAAGRRARKAARSSRHTAERAQRKATRSQRHARARMKELEAALVPRVEAAAERAATLRDDLSERTSAVTTQMKDRAAELKERR
jgi:hypothetical protein